MLKSGFAGLPQAIEASTAAMGGFVAVMAAVSYLALDKLIFTSDEAVKKAKQSAQEYSNQKDKVEGLNSELDTTRARIDELKAKGSLTLVESQELANLESANEKLKIQLEIEKQIAQYKQSAAAHDANDALTDSSFSGNWDGHMKLSTSDYNPFSGFYNQLASSGNMIEYAKTEFDIIQKLTEEEDKYMKHLAELEPGTAEFDATQRALTMVQDARTRFEGDLGSVLESIRSFEGSLYDDFGNIIVGCEDTAQAINNLWSDLASDTDKAADAQSKINSFLDRPTLKEYVDQVKAAFSEANEAMSENDFRDQFPELAKAADNAGVKIVDVIDTIASSLGLLDFDEVKRQLYDFHPDRKSWGEWARYLDTLEPDKLKKLYEAMQNGTDWSTWDWPDFEAFFDDTEEAVESITTLSEAYEKFDEITSTIDKLTEAHEKLADGSLELADVIDLIEEFPDLAEYVDLTADNFGNLDDGLRAVANDAPTALVDELRNFAETADLTDAQRNIILDLSDALASMPESSLDSLSSKYGELADEVSAAKRAVDELNSSLSEDTNTGYTTRAKAMEEMMDLMEHGAIGSESKLWSIADSFGVSELIDFSNGLEAAADQLDELITVRQRWYDGATEDGYSSEGIQNFVEDVSNMTGVLEQFDDVVWEFSEDGINIDIPSGQFEDFAHAIGMGTDELVDMLIQLGQFLDFDWTDVVPDEIVDERLKAEVDVGADTTEYDATIDGIQNESGKIALPVDADPSKANASMGEWRAEQKSATTSVPIDTDNSGVEVGVAEAKETVASADADPITLDIDASQAVEKVVNTQRLINSMRGKTVDVKVRVNGLSDLQNAINRIAKIQSKSVTVTTYTQTTQLKKLYVNGTAHASGNWGTPRTERALTGELGREIVVDPSTGRWYTVGDNGAEFVRIPKGSIVFNHKQTEALLRNGHVTGRGNALAEGTAYVSASGSFKKKYSYSSSTSSSSSSSSSKTSGSSSYSSSNKSSSTTAKSTSNTELENWFERLYAYHQHLVAMEQESQESYIQWLTAAYKQAYNEGVITLEDYYKYQEEVFQGLRDIYEDYLDDVEHEVSMREHFKGEEQNIIALFQEALTSIENEIVSARKAGLDDNDQWIQTLQDRWWEYYGYLTDLDEEYTKSAKDATGDLINIRINMLKQEIKDEKSAISERLKNLKEFYKKQKEMLKASYDEEDYLKEQTEKRKSVSDIEMELEQLSLDNSAWANKRRLQLEEDLAAARDDLYKFERDHALEIAQDQLDALYDQQEAALNKETDLLDEKLDYARGLYEQALDDIRNGSVKLYDEMIEYNAHYGSGIDEEITEAWEAAYAALDDYYNLFKEAYKDINLANATGYTTEGSWDTQLISDKGYQAAVAAGVISPDTTTTTTTTTSGSSTSTTSSSTKSYPYGKASATSGNIGQGSKGNSVKAIQWALNQMGSGNSGTKGLDGIYGAKTAAAVKAFQKWMNNNKGYSLAVDGIVGKNTRKAFAAMGYAIGTTNATPGLHRVDERGDEFIFESSNGNRYRLFSGGEKVLNAKATDFLYQFAMSGGKILTDLIKSSFSHSDFDNINNARSIGEVVMGDIIINGNADQRTVSQIRREQREGVDYLLTRFAKLGK